jgi:hypothetical protein
MISPFFILVIIALIFAVLSMIWPTYPLLPVAVLLVCVALLINTVPAMRAGQPPAPITR